MAKRTGRTTSWGEHAAWYDRLLDSEGTYQRDVILPNLLRLMAIEKDDDVLDLACGPGFFSREFHGRGARVTGVDISPELIAAARRRCPPGVRFKAGSADNLSFVDDASMDKVVIVLAIQNMENVRGVFQECRRVLRPSGRLFFVMNHPAFRVPGDSSWVDDRENRVMYRRVDRYMSESKVKVFMHPGDNPGEYTISFHRPLQFYFKSLNRSGFCVSRLEEWISNRVSQPGPRAAAENRARKEIPLFLFIEAVPVPPLPPRPSV